MEGVRLADFGIGMASARQFILRFGWKSPAGTYNVSINNGIHSFVANIVISAGQANTDTVQTVVIPAYTAGVWNTGAVAMLAIYFTVAAGSSSVGAAGWQAADRYITSATTNGVATAGNIFELYDVGLYLDPLNTGVAPPWTMPDEADELSACQRYWQRYNNLLNTSGYTAGNHHFCAPLTVSMRTLPAESFANVTYNNCTGVTSYAVTSSTLGYYSSVTTAGAMYVITDVILNARL